MKRLLLLALVVFLPGSIRAAALVFPPGVKGDGKADDTEALQRLLDRPSAVVQLPPGTYLIHSLQVADDATLAGPADGSAVLAAGPGDDPLLSLGNRSVLRNLTVAGNGAMRKGVWGQEVSGVTLEGLRIHDLKRAGIELDHADTFTIRKCELQRVERGIHLIFSSHGVVEENVIRDYTLHGIQFWGNWEWKEQKIEDLRIAKNTVSNGGLGAIWGAGASDVHLVENTVAGALDVGLDLEWCRDSSIERNVAHGIGNAGIALFFSCSHIQIVDNTVYNDAPPATYTDGHPTHRYGIWLTSPNLAEFSGDIGHRDIFILRNRVLSGPDAGKPVQIGFATLGVIEKDTVAQKLEGAAP